MPNPTRRALLAVALVAGRLLHAQQPPPRGAGRIDGVVVDSVAARPVAGAAVVVMRVNPDPGYFSVVTDGQGRFHVDSLASGTYEITVSTPLLDSLEVALPPRQVALGDGDHVRVDLALPSPATLRAAACPGLQLPAGLGAVVGRVTTVDAAHPLRNTVVAVSWNELRIDPATKRPVSEPRTGGVRSDSLGQYRLCGVPTDNALLIQVQQAEKVGSVIQLIVPADPGVNVLNLSYSEADARVATDSAGPADSIARMQPAGEAVLSGTIRTEGGRPVADAQVKVVDAGQPVRTDSAGRFMIKGLPAGTQLLEARRVGFRIGRQPVELRAGRTTTQDVRLVQIVTLDSVRVLAQRTTNSQFDDNRRRYAGFGTFVREDAIMRRNPREMTDLMGAYGLRVTGDGFDAKLYYGRGMKSFQLGPCPVNVVIDRVPNQDINLVRPEDVAAMEVYRGSAGAPAQYDAACGLVVIWTKR